MNQSLFIKTIISLSLLGVIFTQIDLSALGGLADSIGGVFWAFALLFLLAQIMLLSVRWLLLANLDRRRIDFITSWRIMIASLLANLLFITSLGGVVAKVALTTQYGFPWLKSICAGVADRIMTLLAITLIALVLLPLTLNYFKPELVDGLIWLICGAGVLLMFLYSIRKNINIDKMIFFNRKTALASHYIRELFSRRESLLTLISVSLLAQIFYFVAVYCLILSLGIDVGLIEIAAILPFVTLVSSLPIGFGGWGVREGAFIYGFGLVGVSVEAAFLLSVQIGILSVISIVIAGVPALINGDFQKLYGGITGKIAS